jgi:cobaltochelatase CobN
MRKLEELVDEYYQAAGMDRRRLAHLQKEIIDISAAIGLSQDIGLGTYSSADDTLSAIDNYLCELKELQIRDGLHVFGTSPSGDLLRDLALAILRAPRGRGVEQQSFMRAMAQDLGFAAFDPLDTDFSMAWQHEKPICLQSVSKDAWRTAGDTVERLELLAQRILDGTFTVPANWAHTQAVYRYFQQDLQPKLRACGANEMDNLLHGLAGGHVLAGASGAPSRGRPDVLPTGRNFYSVDCRSVPTQAAWALGWKSATLLLERHFQDHGEFPTRIGLSAWGTANMRTGGDDIAQALALLGVRPRWDDLSSRVIGFEILPLSVLGRPRVDVVFRVSGFFRDAFPQQLDVLDSAIRAVAALDEPADENPIAAHVNATKAALVAQGHDDAQAEKTAASRVIGSKPGAYGAGMQALIDEGIWHDKSDFAAAYVAWGSYAYGGGQEGTHAPEHTKHILAGVQAVVQNQDNREHDILDSDDYYQFQGGMAATVTALSGREPAVYHGDTSRTETPIIRTLSEEIGRIVRGRAANPKWINGVKRHGYKGAFEMVATVDYLFAYSATTSAVESHHYQQLFDAYLGDAETRNFIQQHNPDGLQDMAQRFQDAITRGLWPVRSNSVFATLDEIYQMRIK